MCVLHWWKHFSTALDFQTQTRANDDDDDDDEEEEDYGRLVEITCYESNQTFVVHYYSLFT